MATRHTATATRFSTLPAFLRALSAGAILATCLLEPLCGADAPVRLEGEVVDAETGAPLPSRLYLEGPAGKWHTVRSASSEGSAVRYSKQRFRSVEIHTTLSAHPFVADLSPGQYALTAERGKEYFPEERKIQLEGEAVRVKIELRRWIDMAARGWYSGDTHVHRSLQDLPNLLLAEDLNVAFPLLYWVTHAFKPPSRGDRSTAEEAGGDLIEVDSTHAIWPRNTEYEIFSVNGKAHTLGAFFLLGHRSVFEFGAPPVEPIARKAHEEGGLIELDKHAWPWSMCIVPVMNVDLYEISNNHVWRTEFGFRNFGEPAAPYMNVERDARGMTEWGWIAYGLENYYALLNCGFRLRPTAGTASGVHPVPLGFGRVYVKLDGPFDYRAWLRGLDAGRSFVTTGPMLFFSVNGKLPGHAFKEKGSVPYRLEFAAVSERPLDRIELISAGRVAGLFRPSNLRIEAGAYESRAELSMTFGRSTWIAARAIEKRPGGRVRFAHTGPVYIDIEGRPLAPRKEEVDFLIRRAESQIARSQSALPTAAIDEYRKALEVFRKIAEKAR